MQTKVARLLVLAACLSGCAASQPKPTTPARTELVVQEPTVVTASPRGYQGRVVELPPWPAALDTYSSTFQCAALLLRDILEKLDLESVQYPAVCGAEVGTLPHERVLATLVALHMLEPSFGADAAPAEAHMAKALAALALRDALSRQLVAPEAPAGAALDDTQRTAYAAEAKARNGQLLHGTLYTLHGCTSEPDPAIAAFRALCSSAYDQLDAYVKADPALAGALSSRRIALRQEAAGERPPGPSVCWTPTVLHQDASGGKPLDLGASAAEPDFSQMLTLSAAPEKAKTCALASDAKLEPAAPWAKPPSFEEEFAGPWPRDHRYGARADGTDDRVSLLVITDASLDVRPLLAASLHAALAKCLAADATVAPATTYALEAALSVTATGKASITRIADVREEGADSAPAGKALLKCVRGALAGVSFSCTANDKKAGATVNVCLRRER
ncbi:MAG TPA: hypothetical protein VHM19_13420 [Polyangiales bacterium]|nr:hypothetical protein [Polyangiales bacterium]